jgi:inorganic phosphate transporter, PiT family
MLALLALVVLTALAFDYINGFHDTANAVATVISTGVLPARTAIMMSALLNFAGAFISLAVADFISKDMVELRSGAAAALFEAHQVTPAIGALLVIFAGLLGASLWNLLTWYFGIPSSSSHALLGGIVGAAWVSLDGSVVKTAGLKKALTGLLISPLAGMILAFLLMIAVSWIAKGARPGVARKTFRRLQLMSAGLMALSHGSNDAQ